MSERTYTTQYFLALHPSTIGCHPSYLYKMREQTPAEKMEEALRLVPDGVETAEVRWWRPIDALAAFDRKGTGGWMLATFPLSDYPS